MKKYMKIMVGIPGSGKSTFVNSQFPDYTVICADDIRKAMGHVFFMPMETMVHALTILYARVAMERGKNVVIDETNVRARYVRTWVELAKDYGYEATVVRMLTSPDVCKERRDNGFPHSVIDKMHRELKEDWDKIKELDATHGVFIHYADGTAKY